MDRYFNINDLPWINTNQGMQKKVLGRSVLGSSALKLVCIAPNTKYETHEHSHLQVMIFKKTIDGYVLIDEERKYKIVENMVLVIKPNQCHKVINKSDEMLEILVLESFDAARHSTPFVDF